MKRTKKEAEQTKEAILKAGVIVIYEKGFEATRLCDIAKEAGVTRGAIYWHFNNKIDLMKEIHTQIRDHSLDIVFENFSEGMSHEEWIEKAMISLAEKLYADKEWWMMHYVLISNDWKNYLGEDLIKELQNDMSGKLRFLIEPKLRNGSLPYSYDEIIFWMIIFISGIVSALKLNRSEISITYIRNFMAVIRAGMETSSTKEIINEKTDN